MRVLFLFLDGIGLGKDAQDFNPFFTAKTPNLDALLNGKKLLASTPPLSNQCCTFRGIDALMGINGLPQSATNQATLVTGINFPKLLGYHYGPKPNQEITSYFLGESASVEASSESRSQNSTTYRSLFSKLTSRGCNVGLLNAYPDLYFQNINSRRRNHAVFPLAASAAGIRLLNQEELFTGKALSADFTGQGWRDHLGILDAPIISPYEAGERLSTLSENYDFSLFEYWESDIAGHKQDISRAIQVIEKIDQVLGGLLNSWNYEQGAILISSDHGNLEDLSTRKHTLNNVPALLIGDPEYQNRFNQKVSSIADITPIILEFIFMESI